MKNMFLIAGLVTLSFATCLVWIDNALANQLKKEPAPQTLQPGIPEIALPEVVITARRPQLAAPTCIP